MLESDVLSYTWKQKFNILMYMYHLENTLPIYIGNCKNESVAISYDLPIILQTFWWGDFGVNITLLYNL